MASTFYISVAKGLKLKVGKFGGLDPTFVEVTGEKAGTGKGGEDWLFGPLILNRVNALESWCTGEAMCD